MFHITYILHFNIKYSNISRNAKGFSFSVSKCAHIYCKCKITHCKVGVFGMSQCVFTPWVPASGGHFLCQSSTLLHGAPSRVSQEFETTASRNFTPQHTANSPWTFWVVGISRTWGQMTLTRRLIGYWTTKRSVTNVHSIIWHPAPPYLCWHRWAAFMTAWNCRWRWTSEHNNRPPPNQNKLQINIWGVKT